LQIVESCDATSVAMEVLIDVSHSMSQVFGGSYGTKLDVAKMIAAQYIGELNTTKDTIGLMSFSASPREELAITDDVPALSAKLALLSTEDNDTDINEGIKAARVILDASGADRRVILLITDGYNNEEDPTEAAKTFRESGGVLIVVALRAGIAAFMLCEKIASGGFFVSAYDDPTAADARSKVSGMKGYLCAGNCTPDEGYVATGQLNYTGFANWNVTGKMDLIGAGLYDLIPGHGLYLDMVGSSAPWKGAITSKSEFTLYSGQNYRLSYKLAGNQRADFTGYVVRVQVGDVLNTTRAMNNWKQDFTTYTNDFAGDGSNGQIFFSQEETPSEGGAQPFGVLLDEIKLENLTTGEVLFVENFDHENLQYHPPRCGLGTVYGEGPTGGYDAGYDCYGEGCLTEPVGVQAHDPNPPEDIEATQAEPASFTSTQSYTAECPEDTTGESVTRSATYKSFISAADAESKAYAKARELAEDDLECASNPAVAELLNVHFFINPDSSSISLKHGFSVVGNTDADFWNRGEGGYQTLKKSTGEFSTNHLIRLPVYGYVETEVGESVVEVAYERDPSQPDQMIQRGLFFRQADGVTPKKIGYAIDGLAEGTYELYVYGHGPLASHTCFANARSGNVLNPESEPEWDITGETDYGTGETTDDEAGFIETAWSQNQNFIKFNITIAPGQTAVVIQFLASNWSGVVCANGIQLLRVT